MNLEELRRAKEEIEDMIVSTASEMENGEDACTCKVKNTVDVIRYGIPEDGDPAIQIDSYCTKCGGYVIWS